MQRCVIPSLPKSSVSNIIALELSRYGAKTFGRMTQGWNTTLPLNLLALERTTSGRAFLKCTTLNEVYVRPKRPESGNFRSRAIASWGDEVVNTGRSYHS